MQKQKRQQLPLWLTRDYQSVLASYTTKLCQYDKHTYYYAATPVYNAQVIGCTFGSAGSWQAPFVRAFYVHWKLDIVNSIKVY